MKYLFLVFVLISSTVYADTVEERLNKIEKKLEDLAECAECADFAPNGTILGGSYLYKVDKKGKPTTDGTVRNNFDVKILKTNIVFEGDTLNREFSIIRVYQKPCVSYEGTALVNSKDLILY